MVERETEDSNTQTRSALTSRGVVGFWGSFASVKASNGTATEASRWTYCSVQLGVWSIKGGPHGLEINDNYVLNRF